MAYIVAEVNIWTLQNQINIADTDLSCHGYHEKEDAASTGSTYRKQKKQYIESRSRLWTPTNKRPEKLRDGLKDYEECLHSARCIASCWPSPDILLLILDSGCLIRLELVSEYGDVSKIVVDTSLVGKLTVGVASDALLTDRYIMFASLEKTKLDVFYFSKISEAGSKMPEKLSSLDPVLCPVGLPGRLGRALPRRIAPSPDFKSVLVWWPAAGAEAWPWTPMSSDFERANLAVLRLTESQAEVLCHSRTDYEPVYALFSRKTSSRIYSVEKSMGGKAPSTTAAAARVELCTYDLTKSRLHRTGHTSLSLRGALHHAAWGSEEHRLLLVSEDRHCVVCDELGNSIAQTTAELLPVQILWHPNDCLVVLLSGQGDVQIFDSSLTPISICQLSAEGEPKYLKVLRLSTYFRPDVHIQHAAWHSSSSAGYCAALSDAFVIVFESGPACLVRLTTSYTGSSQSLTSNSLASQYLKCGEVTQAVQLLSGMSWQSSEASSCYACLSAIINHLLRLPLDKTKEVLIEATLGSFYAPQKPLPDVVVLEYRESVGRLARRFFHHLLRYSRFDKAFLLAIDIGSRDLFMDIHYAALDKGDLSLATIARRKAGQRKGDTISPDADISSDDGISTDDNHDSSSSSSESLARAVPPAITRNSVSSTSGSGASWFVPPPALGDPASLEIFPGYLPSHKVAARQSSTDSSRGPAPPVPPRKDKLVPPSQVQAPPLPPRNLTPHYTGADQSGAGRNHAQPAESVVGSTPSAPPSNVQYRHIPGITLPGYCYEADAELTNQLLDDYAALMVDDPLAFHSHLLQNDGGTPSTGVSQAVKVIHFGVV